MSADRLRDWFDAACDRPQEEWEPFLQACDDADLRAEVLELLHRDRRDTAPIDVPRFSARALLDEDAAPETIGAYRVVRRIGRGSMGTVYEASRPDTGDRVAIKVLRAALPTAALLARFRREAEVLARLDHPYIARIHDAGTASLGLGSLPYLVMELVEGEPIDAYCARHGLDDHARLALLARVGEGVEHAHRRGVVHRDLKPSNVLVDAAARPRILDFGAARTNDARVASLHTATGQLVGTLAYMSPEQALGDRAAIDARCDVYALGVLAFELLAGRLPYALDDCPLSEALRRIQVVEPPRLGTLRPELRGAVEAVVARALEKEPGRRYPTMEALVDDLRALARDEPVAARLPGALERVRRFARREPGLVRAAALVAALLVLGTAGTTWGWLEASRQKREAERLLGSQRAAAQRAEHARAEMEAAYEDAAVVVRFFEEVFQSTRPEQLGHDALVVDVLDRASPRIAETFADQPRVAARMHGNLGSSYLLLGKHEEAEPHMEASLRLSEEEHGPEHRQTRSARVQRALLWTQQGRPADAAAELEEVWRVTPPSEVEERALLVLLLSSSYRLCGEPERGEARLLAFAGEDGEVPGLSLDMTENLRIEAADHALARGALDEAERLLVPILEARQARLGERHLDTLIPARLVGSLRMLQGRHEEAEPLVRLRAEVFEQTWGPENPSTVNARATLATLLNDTGRSAEALAIMDELVAQARRVVGPEHPMVADLLRTQSIAALRMGRADGVALTEEALAVGRRAYGERHPHLVVTIANVAEVRREQGRLEEAETLLRESLAICDATLPPGHPNRVRVLGDLARTLAPSGQLDEAQRLAEEALATARDVLGEEHERTTELLAVLADIHGRAGR